MKILDFLFYCNVKWILSKDQTQAMKTSVGSFSALSVAILFMVLSTSIARIIEFSSHKTQLTSTPLLLINVSALLFFFIIRFIYVKKGRLNLILENKIEVYKVSDQTAKKFIFILTLSLILLFIGLPLVLNLI